MASEKTVEFCNKLNVRREDYLAVICYGHSSLLESMLHLPKGLVLCETDEKSKSRAKKRESFSDVRFVDNHSDLRDPKAFDKVLYFYNRKYDDANKTSLFRYLYNMTDDNGVCLIANIPQKNRDAIVGAFERLCRSKGLEDYWVFDNPSTFDFAFKVKHYG